MDNYERFKTNIIIFLILLLIISLFFHYVHYNSLKQKRDGYHQRLFIMSSQANNLAENLEQFLAYYDRTYLDNQTEAKSDEELKSLMDSHWKTVAGTSVDIKYYLGEMEPSIMGKDEAAWNFLHFSLFHTGNQLMYYSFDFLERGTYSLSEEELEQLDAMLIIYQTFAVELEDKSIKLDQIKDKITEQLIRIDPSYEETLEIIFSL